MKKITKPPQVQSRYRVFPDELIEMMGRHPAPEKLAMLGISIGQWKRWTCGQGGVWVSAAQYRLMRFMYRADLSDLLGPSWDGFQIRGETLLFPGLNRPLSVSDLRSTWLYIQQVAGQEANLSRMKRENERLCAALEQAEKEAAFYRQQLILEARMGMMLNRVSTDQE